MKIDAFRDWLLDNGWLISRRKRSTGQWDYYYHPPGFRYRFRSATKVREYISSRELNRARRQADLLQQDLLKLLTQRNQARRRVALLQQELSEKRK